MTWKQFLIVVVAAALIVVAIILGAVFALGGSVSVR